MTVEERNKDWRELLEGLFEQAEKSVKPLPPELTKQLDLLFEIEKRGFREVVLVAVLARLLDDKYQASVDFYSCKPRATYEGPVREVFRKRAIPHGKSGPLNVAKSGQGLNGSWAARRSPRDAGTSVVYIVQSIEGMPPEELRNFGVALASRFLQSAQAVQQLQISVEPEAGSLRLLQTCRRLIDEQPDSGNTPQRVVGLLLEARHESEHSGIVVSGHEDRASTTNTTSKKPGDITEETADGKLVRVYEITVKPFDDQRMQDSYESVVQMGVDIEEIIVMCRPEDAYDRCETPTPKIHAVIGLFLFQNLSYQFVNIFEWIAVQLFEMSQKARLGFVKKLSGYIDDPNTSLGVKQFWKELHES